MDKSSRYYKQVQLLISVLPYVAKEKCFALKGGTAMILRWMETVITYPAKMTLDFD